MTFSPSTAQIHGIFQSEILSAGGKVTDVFDDGQRLFARSVLPDETDVRRGDRVRAGVALRAVDEQILVSPYTFRLVCSNGAIMAHAIQTRQIDRFLGEGDSWESDQVEEQLREAVRACAQPEAFETATGEMRTAMDAAADMMITLMPHLAKMPTEHVGRILQDILHHYGADRDRSTYGLMNAVTATARDTKDPEVRWRLEVIGGAVAAKAKPRARVGRSAAKLAVGV
jgi:hypothetical protein